MVIRDRREHKREPVMMKINYSIDRQMKTGYTTNLSLGGLFMTTDEPYPAGRNLQISFWLPGQKTPVQLSGNVVRSALSAKDKSRRTVGIGIRFHEMPLNLRKVLGEFLDQFQSNVDTFFQRNDLWLEKGD